MNLSRPIAILTAIQGYDWENAFTFAPFARREVVGVVALTEGCNNGEPWVGVFRLRSGHYGHLSAWCNYTGWVSGYGGTRPMLHEVVRELCEENDRYRLKFAIEGGFGGHVVLVNGNPWVETLMNVRETRGGGDG